MLNIIRVNFLELRSNFLLPVVLEVSYSELSSPRASRL